MNPKLPKPRNTSRASKRPDGARVIDLKAFQARKCINNGENAELLEALDRAMRLIGYVVAQINKPQEF